MAMRAIAVAMLLAAACGGEDDECRSSGGCYWSGAEEATCWWTNTGAPALAPSAPGVTCTATGACGAMEHPTCGDVPAVEFCRFTCH